MTTKEQFEAWWQTIKDRWFYFSKLELAETAWQACQDLNNKERESLIAENAMMREALEKVCELSGDPKEHKYDLIWESANKALSTKPRLIEVGRWIEGATEDESDFYPISYCGSEGSGVMCYTIQKGE